MRYFGDYAANATIYFDFSTQKADGTPITLAGTPALAVYKDDNTTQSTAGITLTVGFDGVTGMHNVKLELTDAFYATGHDYSVQITQGTVDGVSVAGRVLGHFSIQNRYSQAIPLIGTPVALDGGAATLAGMLAKLADDNGGATYDATNDSQNKIAGRLPAALVDGRIAANAQVVGDKTGYALTVTPPTASDIATAVWGATSRTLSGFGTLVADIATAVWSAVARTITGGTVTTNSDKTGYALTSAYDKAKNAAAAGEKMDIVDAPNATAVAAIVGDLAQEETAQAIKDKTDNLPSDPADQSEIDDTLAELHIPSIGEANQTLRITDVATTTPLANVEVRAYTTEDASGDNYVGYVSGLDGRVTVYGEFGQDLWIVPIREDRTFAKTKITMPEA